MATRELLGEGDNPTDCTFLLMAPTGTAAYNIHGMTIHTALRLPIRQHSKSSEYTPLSNERLHELRIQFANLTIVIIDEISMVWSQDLYNIHKRLNEIKGTTCADTYFGGVSVIAVGDLYQLPTVAQRPVYGLPKSPLSRLARSLWDKLFNVHKLHTVMRQKDDAEFANLLNRVRVQHHTPDDIDVLKGRIIATSDPLYPMDSLHIFPTNREVDNFNSEKLQTRDKPIVVFRAKDSKPPNSTLSDQFKLPDNPSMTGGLCSVLQLCVSARVMIPTNIDIQDGLVNGTQGEVVDFWRSDSGDIVAVIVKCDDALCGVQTRQKYRQISRQYRDALPIFRDEVYIQLGKHSGQPVTRLQFPLQLCWAWTIHKTQGMTLPTAVVSVAGRFSDGQCYVALSRVTSLSGLFLTNFEPSKIRASKEVTTVLAAMDENPVGISVNMIILCPSHVVSVALLNIRSIQKHIEDVKTCDGIKHADIVCLTETWLKRQQTPDLNNMEKFRQDRQGRRSGGVLIYVNKQFSCITVFMTTNRNVDLLMVKVDTQQPLFIVLVYCAVDANIQMVHSTILDAIKHIPQRATVVLLGDFNKAHSSTYVNHLLQEFSLQSFIEEPTCRTGSSIDRVYSNIGKPCMVHTSSPYFSDHELLWIGLPLLH